MDTKLLIPLSDVGGHVGTTASHIRHWADRLNIPVAEDWAGVSDADARKIIAAFTEAARANAELHSAYEDYCRDWERRRRELGEESFQSYLGEALQTQRTSIPTGFAFMGGLTSIAQPLGGAVYTQANEAAAGARADFERREPRKSLDEFEKSFKKGRKR